MQSMTDKKTALKRRDRSKQRHCFVYVRYIHYTDINENSLFCKPLDKRTTEMDIFHKVDDFFMEMGLQWKEGVGECTDGAAAVPGHTVRFHGRVRSATDSPINFTHCMIHQEALVAKRISPDSRSVV